MAWLIPLIAAAAPYVIKGVSSLFSSSDSGSADAAAGAAGAEKMRRMEEAGKILQNQRGKSKQEGLNMLANRMGAYQGANNVLASMYGQNGSMAPNLNLDAGGPKKMGGPGAYPEGTSMAGFRAGSGDSAKTSHGSRPLSPMEQAEEAKHVSPGRGYTWTSEGTQGGGYWKPPPLPPGVAQATAAVGGGGSQLSAPGAPGAMAPSFRTGLTSAGAGGLNVPRPPPATQAPPAGGAPTSGLASLIARMGGR